MSRYVAYLRVSTARQGRSGLGLASQRTMIGNYLTQDDQLIDEFIEIESGRCDEREQLGRAIAVARKHDARLLIARLDRFSRRVSFIASIMDQGISLVVAEMPNASDFQLHIFAALAQEERRLISERTRAALAEAKKRGVRLGRNGKVLAARHKREAAKFARRLEPVVRPLREGGASYCAIARHLNCSAIQPAKGTRFYPETVKSVLKRIGVN